MKVKYLGSRLPKVVSLPLPFISKCEKTGEVVCNPIGEFEHDDGLFLINNGGMFEEIKEVELPVTTPDPPTRQRVLLDADGNEYDAEQKKALQELYDSGIDISNCKKTPQYTPEGEDMPECECGCGFQLSWKKHYKQRGIARYLRGHYSPLGNKN